jgi:Domain of unknown function(DUF2779)
MKQLKPALSKSRFIAGLQCRKRLYLEVHRRDLMTPSTAAQEHIFETGTRVGERARDQFPGGFLIDTLYYEIDKALDETKTAIASGLKILYEPAFLYNGVLVRVDILEQNPDGRWNLIEVKSTTGIRDPSLEDIAVQRYVSEGAGIPVAGCFHMHLNRGCRFPDLSNLFELLPVDDQVLPILPTIEPRVNEFRELLQQDSAPDIPIGSHCTRPYDCPFMDHCFKGVSEPSIFTIPRIGAGKIDELIRLGITGVADIPDSFPLSEGQKLYAKLCGTGSRKINRPAIRDELSSLRYPLWFLDFETQSDAIPRLNGLGPYGQYPFQYSLHILKEDGTPEHREYLHPDTTDPREPLARTLIDDIGGEGTIIAYNAPFEKRVISELAEYLPESAARLQALNGRFFDLLLIFKRHYFDPAFGGSNSIKKVLPVLVPGLSYKSLEVQSGDSAQLAWAEMISTADPARRTSLARSLKEYCALDTLSMVEILKYLKGEIS